ncbi:hypothetical protein C8R48DRAFT_213473 [Suillus tomentosus]|nr:hypothetical protein C8R48DRAFT_213473 [Suillus tomentosus]
MIISSIIFAQMYYSAKRENPDNDFQRDLLQKDKKREELGTDLIEYIDYITDGSSSVSGASGKREELETNLIEYIDYITDGSSSVSGASGKREELGTNLIEYIDYITDGSSSVSGASEKLGLELGLDEYAPAAKRIV